MTILHFSYKYDLRLALEYFNSFAQTKQVNLLTDFFVDHLQKKYSLASVLLFYFDIHFQAQIFLLENHRTLNILKLNFPNIIKTITNAFKLTNPFYKYA